MEALLGLLFELFLLFLFLLSFFKSPHPRSRSYMSRPPDPFSKGDGKLIKSIKEGCKHSAILNAKQ
jgi:hypothetical protein